MIRRFIAWPALLAVAIGLAILTPQTHRPADPAPPQKPMASGRYTFADCGDTHPPCVTWDEGAWWVVWTLDGAPAPVPTPIDNALDGDGARWWVLPSPVSQGA